MEEEIPVNGEVIPAWNEGVKGDSARLSFREIKEKARKEKAVIAQDSPQSVSETQFDPVPALNAQSPRLSHASDSSSSQARPASKSRVTTRSIDRVKSYSHPYQCKAGSANKKTTTPKAHTLTLKETSAWLPKNTIFFGPNLNPNNLAAIFAEKVELENRLDAPKQVLLKKNYQPAPKPPDIVMDEGVDSQQGLAIEGTVVAGTVPLDSQQQVAHVTELAAQAFQTKDNLPQ